MDGRWSLPVYFDMLGTHTFRNCENAANGSSPDQVYDAKVDISSRVRRSREKDATPDHDTLS